MYQRAFNEIGAYGHASGSTAQKLSTLIHGVDDDDHPHRETVKSLFNKRSPLAPSKQVNESSATARFGNSLGPQNPAFAQPPVHTSAGAVVPTGQELSSLYRIPGQPGTEPVPVVVNPPIVPGTSYYPPRMQTPPASSYQPPVYGYQQQYPGVSGVSGVRPGSVGMQPASTVYQSAKYEYAPVGQSVMGMASTPVHTPVVHAPGLTPMGRDVEARSGSTGAPAILSKRDTERMQRQAAKEAQRREKHEEKREKKKKSSCCK
eukprot:Gregarina_sp_Pseudo_9__958@NODE_1614_length_1451_cov_146_936261_g1497_i0_p1_GENE_NODE_1614_length_1451_cov_146_936261_g1497_i0NODE_1614_length_1451_cov_146_936261_g1497_i0_p1_ORF_typecomplete_len261_score54_37Auts2/PF15336_6/0_6_NODE_1614_length_1451_cov_146_936261_g1497_i094876